MFFPREHTAEQTDEQQELLLFQKLCNFACRHVFCVSTERIAEELHVDAATLAHWRSRYAEVLTQLSTAAFVFRNERLLELILRQYQMTPKGLLELAKKGLLYKDELGRPVLHPEWRALAAARALMGTRKKKGTGKPDAATTAQPAG